jgi:LemA protein
MNPRAALRIFLFFVLLCQYAVIHYFHIFVVMQQEIYAQASGIEVEIQRRNNLIPRLADIARTYAAHERELMQYAADARTLRQSSQKLEGLLGPAQRADAERLVARLVALSERYPNLKAARSYQAFMLKNVTTENRIASARDHYVTLINAYNQAVVTFPGNVFAFFLKFEPMNNFVPDKDQSPIGNKRFFFIF